MNTQYDSKNELNKFIEIETEQGKWYRITKSCSTK